MLVKHTLVQYFNVLVKESDIIVNSPIGCDSITDNAIFEFCLMGDISIDNDFTLIQLPNNFNLIFEEDSSSFIGTNDNESSETSEDKGKNPLPPFPWWIIVLIVIGGLGISGLLLAALYYKFCMSKREEGIRVHKIYNNPVYQSKREREVEEALKELEEEEHFRGGEAF
jgi:hypothetical protein